MVAAHRAEAEFQGGDAEAAVRFTLEALAPTGPCASICRSLSTCATLPRISFISAVREARLTHAKRSTSRTNEIRCPRRVGYSAPGGRTAFEVRQEGADATKIRERAARLCGFTDAHLEALENEREHTERQERDALEEALGEALGVDTYAALVAEGRTWSDARAVSEAQQWREPT